MYIYIMLSIKESKFTTKLKTNVDTQNTITLNKESTNILQYFFHQLKEHTGKVQHITPDIYPVSIDNLHMQSSHLFPKFIINRIKDKMSYVYVYRFPVNHREITLNFIVDKKRNIYNTYYQLVYTWLSIISTYSDTWCSSHLDIHIYLSDVKKLLPPTNGTILGSDHVNTAYTYGGCKYKNEIVIYRKEEWFKVFIHETIHSFALDYSFVDNSDINEQLRMIFPAISKTDSYESYCEVWALIWNSLFHSFVEHPKNFTSFLNSFKKIYSLEFHFARHQVLKILEHMNMKYDDLFTNNTFREKTNVFAYYILKTIVCQNLTGFLSMCNSSDNIMMFERTSEGYERFLELIRQSLSRFRLHKEHLSTSNSLRMTMHDFE